MKVQVKQITGNWEDGYALDKHLIKSTFIGHNEYGHPQFDNLRTEAGEAVFQLKYRSDFSQAILLAEAVRSEIIPKLGKVHFIVPAPASNDRNRQPVPEVASELSKLMGIPCFPEFLVKAKNDAPLVSLKNLRERDAKVEALKNRFIKKQDITGNKKFNALIIDDLYDSGATMEAICNLVRSDRNVDKIYVAALTWK